MWKKTSLTLIIIIMISILSPILVLAKYNNAGETLTNLGVLTGDENGNLMLDKNFKRQDMVVMIARLYREEKTAKNYQGTNIFKDLNASRKFYIPYITWAKDKGLIKGMDVNEFGFDKEVRTQDFQTILLRALGYEDEANNWNKVPEYALNLNIMYSVDSKPTEKLTRGQMAQMILNSLNVKMKDKNITLAENLHLELPELFKIKLSINNNTVNFKGQAELTKNLKIFIRPTSPNINTGSRSYDVKLNENGYFDFTIPNLQNGNYEYRLEGDKERSIFSPFTVSGDSNISNNKFELLNIKVDNPDEIKLFFSEPVNTLKAKDVSNYRTNAGNISYITFADNNKIVVLKLDNNMKDNIFYNISIDNMESTDGNYIVIEKEIFKFESSSKSEVVNYKGYDNYIKINFSNPMDFASITDKSNYYINFKGELVYLPIDSNFNHKGNELEIILPEYIDGEKVIVGENLNSMIISNLKDAYLNDITPLIVNLDFSTNSQNIPKAINYQPNINGKQGIMIDENTLEVKFNTQVLSANISDFEITNAINDEIKIDKVISNGTNIVKLKLINKYNATTIKDGSILIKDNNQIRTTAGVGVKPDYLNFIDALSPKIAPWVKELVCNNSTVFIPFTEKLDKKDVEFYKRDIEILKNGKVLSEGEYKTMINDNYPSNLSVVINNFNPNDEYYLSLTGKNNGIISYIKDEHGNLALTAGPFKIN